MYGSPINALRFKDKQLRFKGSPELRRRSGVGVWGGVGWDLGLQGEENPQEDGKVGKLMFATHCR